MYGANAWLLTGGSTALVIHRKSDRRVRPVVVAALGLATLSVCFVLARAARHRDPAEVIAVRDFWPPRTGGLSPARPEPIGMSA